MPKLKAHSGAKKRFSLTKTGKVKRSHAFKSHLLNGHGKTTKRKRGLRRAPMRTSRRIRDQAHDSV
jgi:large subunit ribosomal protein L35